MAAQALAPEQPAPRTAARTGRALKGVRTVTTAGERAAGGGGIIIMEDVHKWFETYYGPNAGLTEILIPAGYVSVAYDPVYKLSADGKRYDMAHCDVATPLAAPGLPFSLVFRVEPGKEDISLKVAAAYEAASKRRVPPPNFGPL